MGGMGGMDGMGGGARRTFFDEDEDMGPFSSPGGMPGGMPGSRPSTGRRSPRQFSQHAHPSEVLKALPISLEDLYHGVTKRMKISHKTPSGVMEEKVS